MTANMRKAFRRPQCGFFDESVHNGGPDLYPHLRPNGKERNRRATRKDRMLKYSKGDVLLGLSEILVGYRQWSERYINECHGQRKFNYISDRTQNLIRMVKYWDLASNLFRFSKASIEMDSVLYLIKRYLGNAWTVQRLWLRKNCDSVWYINMYIS